MYAYRAWGFYSDVNGYGNIVEPIKDSNVAGHLTTLQTLLGNETPYGPDIKNSAVFTPLAGSLATAQQYFSGALGPSPILRSCQKNFIMLATDGNPTASMAGWDSMYPLSQQIGMHPIHFSVFMITTLGLGFITPPFGLNLFVMAGLTRTPIGAIARQAFPFVIAMVIVSAVIGFVPWFSIFTLGG